MICDHFVNIFWIASDQPSNWISYQDARISRNRFKWFETTSNAEIAANFKFSSKNLTYVYSIYSPMQHNSCELRCFCMFQISSQMASLGLERVTSDHLFCLRNWEQAGAELGQAWVKMSWSRMFVNLNFKDIFCYCQDLWSVYKRWIFEFLKI